ncbi:MAG TPA: hypothetical protein DCY03_02185 [Planctomycetaceae bacterium]|nr:hypothetical protein [Planctomycetaceae bacterium]
MGEFYLSVTGKQDQRLQGKGLLIALSGLTDYIRDTQRLIPPDRNNSKSIPGGLPLKGYPIPDSGLKLI